LTGLPDPVAGAIEAAVSRVLVDQLPEGVVLWRAWLDPLVAVSNGLHEWLSPDEELRAARFHFDRDRVRYIAGRSLLRWLISRPLNKHPASVEIECDALGKPFLASTAVPPIHFNISHSEGLAVFAFSDTGEIGVDVERLRPVPEAESILELHFSGAAAQWWSRLPSEQQSESFLRTWVRYEAWAKHSGLGLAQSAENGLNWTDAGGLANPGGNLPPIRSDADRSPKNTLAVVPVGGRAALPNGPVARSTRKSASVLEFEPAAGFVGAVVF